MSLVVLVWRTQRDLNINLSTFASNGIAFY